MTNQFPESPSPSEPQEFGTSIKKKILTNADAETPREVGGQTETPSLSVRLPLASDPEMDGLTDSSLLTDLNPKEQQKALAALKFLDGLRRADARFADHGLNCATESEGIVISNIAGVTRDSMPSRIGKYKIVSSLGRGGFAEVFLAVDPDLERQVALKIPLIVGATNPDAQQRFQREAKATALLSHPAIVPVFEVGSIGAVDYIAFEYCPGPTLAQFMGESRGQLDQSTAAAVIASLADAVQHAHQRGIIHRDLKPSNVLLDSRPEKAAQPLSARVRIADFGLAFRTAADDPSLTIEGTAIGTPAYMSPEQATGNSEPSQSGDIYALGMILYEMLTGTLPFRRSSHLLTLKAVQTQEPPSPRSIIPSISADLEAICLKCLAKEPSARYASAYELHEDLNCWLQGLPIKAKLPGPLRRIWYWVRRHRLTAALGGAALMSLLIGLGMTTWQWNLAQSNANRYKSEFLRAEENLTAAALALENERIQRIRAQKIARWLGNTYRSPAPGVQGRELKVIQLLERAEKEIGQEFDTDAETRWTLWLAIAKAWFELGENQSALGLLEQIQDEQSTARRPDDEMTVEVLIYSAKALSNQGEMKTALTYNDKALELANRILDPMHPMIYQLKLDKASALANLGRIDEATDLRIEVVTHYRTSDGGANVERLKAEWALANGLVQKRELATAESAFAVLIPELEEELGTDDPLTLTAKNDYANALHHQKKHNELAALRRDIFESTERVMGPNHPNTILVLNNLAVSLSQAGQKQQAIDCWADQVNRAKICFGEQSAFYFLAIVSPANAYRELGDFDEALARYETAVPGLQNTLGHTHAKVLLYQASWAELLETKGQFEKAFLNWDQIRKAQLEIGEGPGLRSESAGFRQSLLSIRMGKVKDGIESSRQFLDFLLTLDLPPNELNDLTCHSHGSILKALVDVDAFDEAVPFSESYLKLTESEHSSKCDTVVAHWFQTVLLVGTSDFEKARQVLEQCLSEDPRTLPEPELQWSRFCIDKLLNLCESVSHPLHDLTEALRFHKSGFRQSPR